MFVQSYLFFDGRAEEAMDFYKKALGAQIEMMMRFKESPEPSHNPPGSEDKIMHASFRVGDTVIMASDGDCKGDMNNFAGFALTINVKDKDEANRVFGALSEGGQIIMPLSETFFSPCFGMVKDRFNVTWMTIVS